MAGQGGLFTVADMLDAIKPPADHFPRTRLVVIENTHKTLRAVTHLNISSAEAVQAAGVLRSIVAH